MGHFCSFRQKNQINKNIFIRCTKTQIYNTQCYCYRGSEMVKTVTSSLSNVLCHLPPKQPWSIPCAQLNSMWISDFGARLIVFRQRNVQFPVFSRQIAPESALPRARVKSERISVLCERSWGFLLISPLINKLAFVGGFACVKSGLI